MQSHTHLFSLSLNLVDIVVESLSQKPERSQELCGLFHHRLKPVLVISSHLLGEATCEPWAPGESVILWLRKCGSTSPLVGPWNCSASISNISLRWGVSQHGMWRCIRFDHLSSVNPSNHRSLADFLPCHGVRGPGSRTDTTQFPFPGRREWEEGSKAVGMAVSYPFPFSFRKSEARRGKVQKLCRRSWPCRISGSLLNLGGTRSRQSWIMWLIA